MARVLWRQMPGHEYGTILAFRVVLESAVRPARHGKVSEIRKESSRPIGVC